MSWMSNRRVLVPVDFSELSLAAVPLGLEMVDEPSHLCVLHVAPRVVKGDPGFPWDPLGEETQRARLLKSFHDHLAEATPEQQAGRCQDVCVVINNEN